ncbi:hypothetical protein BDZ97DRAFT_1797639, partial [Flammula alnicola]
FEAGAVHCAQLNDLHRLKPSQNFIIRDMGGSTVDLAVYKLTYLNYVYSFHSASFVLISADAIDNFNRSSVECIRYRYNLIVSEFSFQSLEFFFQLLDALPLLLCRQSFTRLLESLIEFGFARRKIVFHIHGPSRFPTLYRTSIIVERIRVSPPTNGAVANRPVEFVALIYWTGVIIA